MPIILHDEAYYASRIPRPDLGPIRNFMRFIWDNERKAFFDRTAREWGNINGDIRYSFFSIFLYSKLSFNNFAITLTYALKSSVSCQLKWLKRS